MTPDVPAPRRSRVRSDKKLTLRARKHLLRRINADIDFWYDLVKTHAVIAERQQDPAVRMAMKMIDKVLAEQREVEQPPPVAPGGGGQIVVQIGVGIQRGTAEARQLALQHQDDQRITLTVDAQTTDPDPASDRSVQRSEPLGDSVS